MLVMYCVHNTSYLEKYALLFKFALTPINTHHTVIPVLVCWPRRREGYFLYLGDIFKGAYNNTKTADLFLKFFDYIGQHGTLSLISLSGGCEN